MQRSTGPLNRLIAGLGGLTVVLALLASSGTAGAATSVGSTVLSPSYAKSIGFATTVQAAKQTKVTNQKGCTFLVQAVYEDAAAKTGLASETVQCTSNAAAARALATAKKQVKVDRSVSAPKQLGPAAFVTATDAPEYFVAWVHGSRVAITAIDLNIAASSTSKTASPLTAAEMKTLGAAALKQNALYH